MTAAGVDRRRELLQASDLNGIDFVTFSEGQLRVHFQTRVHLAGRVIRARISGGWPAETTRVVAVRADDWTSSEGRPLLVLPVKAPGDFSTYRIALEGGPLDPYFAQAAFTFAPSAPRTVDCEAPVVVTAPAAESLPTMDYLAKDFMSFRQVLSDFSAQRYPAWQERSEADFGVMFMEALCSVADDLSYQQDRIAAEAYLDTATQRVSVVRQARLVDYEPRPSLAARTWLQFSVTGGPVPSGLRVSGRRPDGSTVTFETGSGLAAAKSYAVNPAWNTMTPYLWDEGDSVLRSGSTEMWVRRHGLALKAGVRLVIDTASPSAGIFVRQMVTLTADGREETDPVLDVPVTRLAWGGDDALRADHELQRTTVRGNLVPATEGVSCTESFSVAAPSSGAAPAVVRTGPNGTPQYLYSLLQSPLAWIAVSSDPSAIALPEIRVTRREDATPWTWAPSLLDAGPLDATFTVDPGAYRSVGPPRADGSVPMDYAGDPGDTIRFGDGDNGVIPSSPSTFDVSYRSGGGQAGNVGSDVLTLVDPMDPAAALVSAVTNPFPATGGADPESLEMIRRLAPDAIAAAQFRAVAPADYDAVAAGLPWVQSAKTHLRYTGSWLSMRTYVAARDSKLPSDEHLSALAAIFARYRMAGVESSVYPVRYAALDLEVDVQAARHASSRAVKLALAQALSAVKLPGGVTGFFCAGAFGIGQALERTALETAILAVPGVESIHHILVRRRGGTASYEEMPASVGVAHDEVVSVEGDPRRPDAGSVRIDVRGGQ
jgi:hypothetical protein